jgi:hypothetical protein
MSAAPVQLVSAKHFIDKGLPVNGAVAMTCVLYFESRLNPGPQGNQPTETPGVLNMHGAYGIASWNGPRQTGLNNYALAHGRDVGLLDTQLDFVVNEIANHFPRSWAAIRSADTCESIIATLVAEYENPADHPKEIAGAIAFSGPLLDAVRDYIPAASAPATPLPIPAPLPLPSMGTIQVPIELIIQLVAPLAESLIQGLLKGALAHAQPGSIVLPSAPAPQVPGMGLPPTLPPIDFAQWAQQIAAELAKLQQGKPA